MYPNEVQDRKEIEEIVGSPLPELEPIYWEAAEQWEPGDAHITITAYFLSHMFTPVEMKMVLALPGTAKDVADKTGYPERYCSVLLKGLFRKGRLMRPKKYDNEDKEHYSKIWQRVTLGDYITMAFFRERRDLAEERDLFLLLELWAEKGHESAASKSAEINPFSTGFRVIPKWNSIKNIPGIMTSENMKEIFQENFEKGALGWQRCVCRARNTLRKTGHSIIPEGISCEAGLVEYDQEDGHCLWFGIERTKYMKEQFDIHIAQSEEERDRCFNEIEEAVSVYSTTNRRGIGCCCVCCPDCCGALRSYHKGGSGYIESRFKPEVSLDKCVGCKVCESKCPFKAISYDTNGKCVIDPKACKGCGNCVIKCPTKALKMKVVHDVDWIPDIGDYVK